MFEGKSIETWIKRSFTKDFIAGSVWIQDEKITLDPKTYFKRVKIFSKDVWVDTKPIIIGENDTNSIPPLDNSSNKPVINKTDISNKLLFSNIYDKFINLLINTCVFLLFATSYIFYKINSSESEDLFEIELSKEEINNNIMDTLSNENIPKIITNKSYNTLELENSSVLDDEILPSSTNEGLVESNTLNSDTLVAFKNNWDN